MENREQTVYLTCSCRSPEHLIKVYLNTFVYDDDKCTMPDLEFTVQVHPDHGFFRRLWISLKYVFGVTRRAGCSYYHPCWAALILEDEGIEELSKILLTYRLITKLRKAKLAKNTGRLAESG